MNTLSFEPSIVRSVYEDMENSQIRLVSSKLTDILTTPMFNHGWRDMHAANNILNRLMNVVNVSADNIDKYALDVIEIIYYFDQSAYLYMNNFMVLTNDNEVIHYDISQVKHTLVGYHESTIFEYKIIGISSEIMDANEYVTVPSTGKIQFDENHVAVSRKIKKEYKNLYVYCAKLDLYYVISFIELNIACNKGTPCTVGKLDVYVCEPRNHAMDCEYAFTSTDIMEFNTKTDIRVAYYDMSDETQTYPLFEYSYDGNDDMFPCGYAKLVLTVSK